MRPEGSTDQAEIHAVAEALRVAVNAGNISGILECWAPHGVLLPPHHPAVHGHAAIAEYFRVVFAARRLTFAFTESVVSVLGDVALERLAYTAITTEVTSGGATRDVGKGLHVYARGPDGAWKLTQDIWNSDRPVPLRDGSWPIGQADHHPNAG